MELQVCTRHLLKTLTTSKPVRVVLFLIYGFVYYSFMNAKVYKYNIYNVYTDHAESSLNCQLNA